MCKASDMCYYISVKAFSKMNRQIEESEVLNIKLNCKKLIRIVKVSLCIGLLGVLSVSVS